MIIKGKEFSEETIVEALKAHCDWFVVEEPKAGDVFSGGNVCIRVVIFSCGKLRAFGNEGVGGIRACDLAKFGYKKVGTIGEIRFRKAKNE